MTLPLAAAGACVTAVEPAPAMAEQLAATAPDVPIIRATGEDTGLPESSVDLVVYAQSWHWMDAQAAAAEAHRILVEGGRVAVVFNQLDVRVAWVKRLTRIMRSGDVHWPNRPPRLGPGFTAPSLRMIPWVQHLSPEGIATLGSTRSSYLRASDAGKVHMRANLDWYLADYLHIGPDRVVELPYYTLVWSATRR